MTTRDAGFRRRVVWASVAVMSVVNVGTAAAHPLDPLTAGEVRLAAKVIKADPRMATAALSFIAVADPPKADVIAWQAGRTLPRRARALAATATGVFEVLVDLETSRLVSAIERTGVQGPLTREEAMNSARVALADPQFQAGLRVRGLTDTSKLFCAPWTVGYFGIPKVRRQAGADGGVLRHTAHHEQHVRLAD